MKIRCTVEIKPDKESEADLANYATVCQTAVQGLILWIRLQAEKPKDRDMT